jgi:hypothetical protein
MLRLTTILSLLVLMTMVTACSSGGGPTGPDLPGSVGSRMTQLPFYVNPSSDAAISGTGAMGVYQVHLDLESMTYELVPQRLSSFVPNEFEVDLTLALTSSFCKDCFVINGLSINSEGHILLQTGVKHPFPQVTQLPAPKPQRPDLHIFDVQGICVVDGSTAFSRSGITLNPEFVVNPDGYTTAFDSVIDSLGGAFTTSANCHPFKILSKGNYTTSAQEIGNYDPLSLNGYPNPTGIINPTGFNVLKCGADYMYTTYELNPEGSIVDFFFVVTCSYGQSAKGLGSGLQRRDSPVYLMPAFSKPEAWWVKVDVENNDLADNDNNSTAEIVVRCADWQEAWGISPANPSFDPVIDQSLARNTLLKESGIKKVEIDVPGLNLPVDDSTAITPTGTGTYTNPKIYRVTVNNDTYASEIPDPGNPPQFWGLVSVLDDLEGIPNNTGGIDRDLDILSSFFTISDYTTYQVFGISIYPPNDPPVPVITCSDPGGDPPYSISSGYSIDLDGSTSFDTDGAIAQYEWDFDYEVGGLFAAPGDPNYLLQDDPVDPTFGNPDPFKMNNLLDVAASKYVALRVTDDSLGETQSTTWVEVQLGANQIPTADLGVAFYDTLFPAAPYEFYSGERVTLKPGPLTDDDGAITTYQYDFSYDGATFYVDGANTTGAPVMTPPQTTGTVDMATRVVDNGIPNLNAIDTKSITILGPAVYAPVKISPTGASNVDCSNAGFHSIAVSNDNIVCAWSQQNNLRDIYYSVSSDSGATWSAAAVLNTTGTGTQEHVSLCADPGENVFYAAYENNASGSTQISWAISETGGTSWLAGKQGTISALGTNLADPTICVNPSSNQIYIAFTTTISGNKTVIVRTSTDAGASWSAGSTINTSSTGDRTDPCIAWDSTNNLVGVAWDDLRGGTAYQIFFNWSNSSGTAFQVADIHVASTAAGQNDPSVVNAGGTWYMTYDDLSGTTDVFLTSSSDGTTWSVPVDITDNTSGAHNDSSVCIDGTGTIYIASKDDRETDNPTQADVYVFKSLDGGTTWVRGVRINYRAGTENSYHPSIVGLAAGGFVVMYESPDNDVYAAVSNAY